MAGERSHCPCLNPPFISSLQVPRLWVSEPGAMGFCRDTLVLKETLKLSADMGRRGGAVHVAENLVVFPRSQGDRDIPKGL